MAKKLLIAVIKHVTNINSMLKMILSTSVKAIIDHKI